MPQSLLTPRLKTAEAETILLVEDQPAILQYMISCLEDLRYEVLASRDAETALGTMRQHKGRIDLLLTNFSMPGMSGRELARIAELERPGIKVLYMSGYPEEMVWDAAFLKEGPSWLAKPFTMQLLAAGLRKSLGVERRVILVVDEGEEVRAFLRAPLQHEGYDVMEAASLERARKVLSENRIDLVIGDLARFEQEGEETMRKLRRLYPALGIVAMTGNFPAVSKDAPSARARTWHTRTWHTVEATGLKARWLRGADATLPKPVSVKLLIETIGKLLQK